MASWTQGSIVKWIMSPSKLLSKNKTQNSKISTHEQVGSYTHSSRKTHLPQAQANIQLQKTIQNSSTTQWAHHSKNKNFPLHLRNWNLCSHHQPTHTSHPIALRKKKPSLSTWTHTHYGHLIPKPLKSLTPPMKLNFHLLRTKTVNMKIFKTSFQVQEKFETQSQKDMTKFLKPFRTLKSATNDNNSNHQHTPWTNHQEKNSKHSLKGHKPSHQQTSPKIISFPLKAIPKNLYQ